LISGGTELPGNGPSQPESLRCLEREAPGILIQSLPIGARDQETGRQSGHRSPSGHRPCDSLASLSRSGLPRAKRALRPYLRRAGDERTMSSGLEGLSPLWVVDKRP